MITGTVTTGLGEGAAFVMLQGYREQFREQLGYDPYPGTLNVETDDDAAGVFDSVAPIRIDGWCDGDTSYGPVDCYPVTVRTDDGQRYDVCHAVVPHRSDHDTSTVELIAPENLRDLLGLSDGSTLRVSVVGADG